MHGTQDLLDLAGQPKGDLPRKLVGSRLRDVMYGRALRSGTVDAEVADFGCRAALGYCRRCPHVGARLNRAVGVGWWRRARRLFERARATWRCVERVVLLGRRRGLASVSRSCNRRCSYRVRVWYASISTMSARSLSRPSAALNVRSSSRFINGTPSITSADAIAAAVVVGYASQ